MVSVVSHNTTGTVPSIDANMPSLCLGYWHFQQVFSTLQVWFLYPFFFPLKVVNALRKEKKEEMLNC